MATECKNRAELSSRRPERIDAALDVMDATWLPAAFLLPIASQEHVTYDSLTPGVTQGRARQLMPISSRYLLW